MSLFDNLVVKKLMTIYKCGLDLFTINKNFTKPKLSNYPFLSFSYSKSSLNSNNLFVTGHVTNVLTSLLDILIRIHFSSRQDSIEKISNKIP